ncbi:uncharacterized protein [Littorina saxatilis]|uniref:FAD dependent oxidoreductase n=1 Tax=Littorina saxatilis TaxID=31220 RepID=A0AAN9BT87_9CAEN
MQHSFPLAVCFFMTTLPPSLAISHRTEQCDVIVAGGSTAALAAAIAAARDNSQLHVCLTEPTDWLGGQMTSGGVPAIDFGSLNRQAAYQPRDFADMMASFGGGNPGACWVSTKCYLPRHLVEGWIARTVRGFSNLNVFYNSVIKRVQRQGRVISAVEAVQRVPRSGFDQWGQRLSDTWQDWYSESDSHGLTKTLLRLEGRHSLVVVDATEVGDVLVLSQASFHQGAETPTETSLNTLDTCGQAFTFPFYIQNGGKSGVHVSSGKPATFNLEGQDWGHVWSYRRVQHGTGQYHASSPGDVSNQNWGGGNDYKDRYIFLPLQETLQQRSDWQGGVNIAAVREAEDRAYGYYNYYVSIAPSDVRDSLSMAGPDVTGTGTGLSKIPYLRDSRRSVGLQGYQLQKADFAKEVPGTYGVRYPDTVALGDYKYADVHGVHNCPYPHYVNVPAIKPFYIPFRSLTNQDVDNLLVAGKTMAVSFMANAATRMHPMEWNTGMAAGLASSIMASKHMTSQQLYHDVTTLQNKLRAETSLDWTQPRDGAR